LGEVPGQIGCEGTRGVPDAAFPLAAGAASGGAFSRCECKSAVCFFYLQGGRIANSQLTSDSPGTAADPDGAGRVVAVVDSRGEPGDPDSGHGNIE